MNKNNSSDSEKKEGMGCAIGVAIFLILVLFVFPKACSGGNSQYDRDLDSGMDKMISGDEMSDGERDAVNDFLEWQSENY